MATISIKVGFSAAVLAVSVKPCIVLICLQHENNDFVRFDIRSYYWFRGLHFTAFIYVIVTGACRSKLSGYSVGYSVNCDPVILTYMYINFEINIFNKVCFTAAVSARSVKPFIVIVLDILLEETLWPGGIDLYFMLQWLCHNYV